MSHQQPSQVWLEYAYHKHHPALQCLPTKLAEWIANNMQDKLGFPGKVDPRRGWGPVDAGRAEQHSAEPRGEGSEWPRLDDIRVCGMGV